MAFVVRDDDTSYFTLPSSIESVYKEAWSLDFKISLSTVPLIKGSNNLNIPPKYRNSGDLYCIADNDKLVKYLKSKIASQKIGISQHGYCHTENLNLPSLRFDFNKRKLVASKNEPFSLMDFSEFVGLTFEQCLEKVKTGQKVLQALGQPVKTFVAPQEYLPKNLWLALKKENLSYCGYCDIHGFPTRSIRFNQYLIAATRRLTHKSVFPNGICTLSNLPHIIPAYKHYWNKYSTRELSNFWFEDFKTRFEKCFTNHGVFVLVTHYWEYFYDWNDKLTQNLQLEYLNKILEYVSERNVWKCTLTEVFDWINGNKFD
jgi:hypothetical protein